MDWNDHLRNVVAPELRVWVVSRRDADAAVVAEQRGGGDAAEKLQAPTAFESIKVEPGDVVSQCYADALDASLPGNILYGNADFVSKHAHHLGCDRERARQIVRLDGDVNRRIAIKEKGASLSDEHGQFLGSRSRIGAADNQFGLECPIDRFRRRLAELEDIHRERSR